MNSLTVLKGGIKEVRWTGDRLGSGVFTDADRGALRGWGQSISNLNESRLSQVVTRISHRRNGMRHGMRHGGVLGVSVIRSAYL